MKFELLIDRNKTQEAIEEAFSKYRIYKYHWLINDELEPSITANYEFSEGGRSNRISDQTSSIVTHKLDQQIMRNNYCSRIEKAVSRLPEIEKKLIEERYMTRESEYLTDYNVYCHKLDPPISAPTYYKIRWRAFLKLALNLNLAVFMDKKNE